MEILDYASPRPHGRVRLPAASVIDILRDGDKTTVLEQLAGKSNAIFSMIFAGVCLAAMTASAWPRNSRDLGGLVCISPVLLAGVGVALLVAHNTWRKTFLVFDREKISLRMTSPFTSRGYEWPIGNVVDAQVATNEKLLGAELVVPMSHGTTLRLFGGHPARELIAIAQEICVTAKVRVPEGLPLANEAPIAKAFVVEPVILFAKVVKKDPP